jgi:hypothetical protein
VNVLSTPPPALPSEPERDARAERRAAIGARFLDSLEEIVRRHRSLAPAEHPELHAELIAAEVAHQLSLVRAELRRAPHLRDG